MKPKSVRAELLAVAAAAALAAPTQACWWWACPPCPPPCYPPAPAYYYTPPIYFPYYGCYYPGYYFPVPYSPTPYYPTPYFPPPATPAAPSAPKTTPPTGAAANPPPARAGGSVKAIHLQVCLYELREAKEDVRDVAELSDEERKEVLAGIDDAVAGLKAAIAAVGGKVEGTPPGDRPKYANYKHLRHAVRMVDAAREQFLVPDGTPSDVRTKALADMDKARQQLKRAIAKIKGE